jgi:hypothetical protein
MQAAGGGDAKAQIKTGFRLATMHDIDENSLQAFLNLYNKAFDRFKKNTGKTCELIGGKNEHNSPETAALAVVANAMLNLDEVVTKN